MYFKYSLRFNKALIFIVRLILNYDIVQFDGVHFERSPMSTSSPLLINKCRTNPPTSTHKILLI